MLTDHKILLQADSVVNLRYIFIENATISQIRSCGVL